MTMMPKEITVFYPNSLCFVKRPNLVGNWFDSQFSNIFWAIEACKSTTKNGGKCHGPAEIEEFMKENLFYFLNQKIEVKADIFWENVKEEERDQYFPLKSKVLSNLYGRLKYPSNGYIDTYEVKLGLDSISVDDQGLL